VTLCWGRSSRELDVEGEAIMNVILREEEKQQGILC
jgi:hypothetical protein